MDRNSDGRDGAIKKISFQRGGYYDPKYGTIKDEDLKLIYSGQKDFRDFLSKLYPASRVEKYSNPLQPHFNIETPDFNVLHIDSTLTYPVHLRLLHEGAWKTPDQYRGHHGHVQLWPV